MEVDDPRIPVRNAGIVLLNVYLTILFERLGLAESREFVNESSQADAVLYLQYVITGSSIAEESMLPLDKVLCGLPLSYPVKNEITISDDKKKIIKSMLKAAIAAWSGVSGSSIEGFRESWLIRTGWLVEQEDRWELTVEKRAYDILISKSPFSFSVIKYNWMDKPLYITWNY